MDLACPACHAPLHDTCRCGARYPRRRGIRDLAPHIHEDQGGIAQRFMESPRVVGIYERVFRPALTRLVSPLDYADEEAFLATWVAAGPALDIACGTGRYTRWLADRLGDDAVVGLDLSRPMLQRARADAPQLTFVRGSALALPVADDTLGTATCFGALHLFPDAAQAIREVGRALRVGGRFVCFTAVEAQRGARLQRAAGSLVTLAFLDATCLRAWCSAADLEVVAWRQEGAMALLAAERVEG